MAADRQAQGTDIIPGYTILKKLGQGGMGAVYKARQTSMDRIVAMKVLPKSLAKQAEFKERFFREARAAGKLNHPNIVTAIDAQEAAGYCYIAMEYVEGKTVAALLSEKGPFSESEALAITHQIAEALGHAWQSHIVHRDVKPENFLYTKDGVAKLCDLGIAKAPSDAGLTQDGTALGTPRYIAPEQARGLDSVDYRADIYSLGASLYHMLAGDPPFDGPTAPAIMLKHVNEPLPSLKRRAPHVSRATVQVVEKMMAKDPKKRYQSAEELTGDLIAVREGRSPPVAGSPKRPSGRKTAVRRAVPAPGRSAAPRMTARKSDNTIYIVLGALLAAGILAFLFWPPSNNGPQPNGNSHKPPPLTQTQREDKARTAFLDAKALRQKGDLQRAFDAFSAIAKDYTGTSYAPLAETQAKEVREEINAAARLQRADAALAQLKQRGKTLAPRAYIAELRKFAADPKHAGHPADSATSIANQIEDRLAAAAAEAETPEQKLQKRIAEAKTLLKGTDWARVRRVLDLVIKRGPALAPLVPDIRALAAHAPNAFIRMRSLQALKAAAPVQADETAKAQLRDRNERVRLAAIAHIRQKRLSSAIPVLQGLISDGPNRDPSPRVLAAAVAAIRDIKR